MPHWYSHQLCSWPCVSEVPVTTVTTVTTAGHSPVFPVSVIRSPGPDPAALACGQWTLTLASQSGTIRGHWGRSHHYLIQGREREISVWDPPGSEVRGGLPGASEARPLLPGDNARSPGPGAGVTVAGAGWPEPEVRGRTGAGQPIGGQWVDNRPIVDNSEPGLASLAA